MASRSRRSRSDPDYYRGYLWDAIEERSEAEKDLKPPDEKSAAGTPPSYALIEKAGERLLSTAREVCALYPPSAHGPYKVSFYGYSSLKSTIRQEKSGVMIRISHLFLDAPKEALAGVLHTLLSRFHGRPVPKDLCKAYDDFCCRPEIEDRARQLRRMRGTKILVGTKGDVRDLDESFERVNETYFNSRLPKPALTWSPGVSRRRMGYYDDEFNTIVISSGLDSTRVPLYVLDYIMYHELLHIVCPIHAAGRRRQIHTEEFKQRERRYQDYDRAVQWITKHWH